MRCLFFFILPFCILVFTSCNKNEVIDQPVTVIDTAYYYKDTTNLQDLIYLGWSQSMLIDSLGDAIVYPGAQGISESYDVDEDGIFDLKIQIKPKLYRVRDGMGAYHEYELPETTVEPLTSFIGIGGKKRLDSLFVNRQKDHNVDIYGDYATTSNWYWGKVYSDDTFVLRKDTTLLNFFEAFTIYGVDDDFANETGVIWVPNTSLGVFFSLGGSYIHDKMNIIQKCPTEISREVYLPYNLSTMTDTLLGWIKLKQTSDTSLFVIEKAIQNH